MKRTASVSSSSCIVPAPSAATASVEPDLQLAIRPCLLAPALVDEPPAGRPLQPRPRVLRDAFARPMIGRRDQRLLDGVLGRVEVARLASERADDLRRKVAQQVLDVGGIGDHALRAPPPAVSSHSSISTGAGGPLSMIRRTWIGCWIGTPPGPGTAGEPRRDLDRPCLGVDVEHLEAGDPLLELPEWTVGHDRRGDPIRCDDLGQVGARQDRRSERARRSRGAHFRDIHASTA